MFPPSDWKPHNTVGTRITMSNKDNRTAIIRLVDPPEFSNEVERLYIEYEDTHEYELVIVRGLKIGDDWIR